MADVDHELSAIRFVVDSPLSSKVAMFNQSSNAHQQSQLLNPFTNANAERGAPRPKFSKEEYGRPVAGSLTEARGQKANIHVCKDMLELCQIINSEGYSHDKEHPKLKVILFGELFNIYTCINDKLVGLLLRARKHKFIDFEGEMLFQRRDDDVPIFMIKTVEEIKKILEEKIEEVRRSASPNPQATNILIK
ncbi:actin-binding Rho-activating protein [Contarinia nasturtii]|uniref:actin-binding Rho-activating protein n=1 Tax=Contarinia nasturtii TaxID=265458 RepID=UPI0012D3C00F|nr:actin-binding Rho-activating protein [Contarinia nasturtii]